MDNPYSLLGIDNKGIDIEEAVAKLEEKVAELKALDNFYEKNFRKRFLAFRSNNRFTIRESKNDDIRDFYEERCVLELPLDKKYFTEQEFEYVVAQAKNFEKRAKEKEREIEILKGNPTRTAKEQREKLQTEADLYRIKSKCFNQSIKEQASSISDEKDRIIESLEAYQSNPDNSNARARIEDLYIRLKFEEAFKNLSIQSPIDSKDHKIFRETLESNSAYRSLIEAYNKVSTVGDREDLDSESYVTKRVSNPVGAISEAEARKITRAEDEYQRKYFYDLHKSVAQRGKEQVAQNPNHLYGWGIILTNPFYLLKDEPIDTPNFKGKITVEDIGRFTEESLFRKVKMETEERKERRKNTQIKGAKKIISEYLGRFFALSPREEDKPERYMRDYYYSYEATKKSYDEIYRVTKTDSEGRTRTQIIFSPINQKSLGKDVSVDFLKNVYFSDFMLDLARKNGGYAGEVFPDKDGRYTVYNYHPNCQEQIGAAILFDRGYYGSILDRREGRNEEYLKADKKRFQELLRRERIRTRDE